MWIARGKKPVITQFLMLPIVLQLPPVTVLDTKLSKTEALTRAEAEGRDHAEPEENE